MKVGSIVDAIISGEEVRYSKKVLKRDDPDLFQEQKEMDKELLVSENVWNDAIARAEAITSSSAYKWYKKNKAKFQVILQGDITVNSNVVPICGMADVITETKDTVYIDDFKSTNLNKLQSAKKWFYNCIDSGYVRQLGAYRYMWRLMNPNDNRDIVCRHLVVAHSKGVVKLKTFIFSEELLDFGESDFLQGVAEIVDRIARDDFEDEPTTWEDAEVFDISGPPRAKAQLATGNAINIT
jgi:hypothetical protein